MVCIGIEKFGHFRIRYLGVLSEVPALCRVNISYSVLPSYP